MKRTKGIACLVLAIVILLIVTGVINLPITGISTGKLIATIILGIIFIGTIISLSFDGTVIFGGILLKMYEKELGFHISVPVLIIVMILLLVAVDNLTPKKRKKGTHTKSYIDENGEVVIERDNSGLEYVEESSEEGSHIYVRSRFNGICKYITSEDFQDAIIDSQFGGVELYFNNAKVPSRCAVVDLDTKFAGVEIHVPKNWRIERELRVSMGDYSEEPIVLEDGEEAPVVLVLEGHVEFGGVKVSRS